ncbi:META domain-containing protein [Pseudomarimonas arenosa]|uniref:META domain-containing protein n=1 Tax=Pseudomarimonas arenosa TaxID=2774145 RepID=A0AAW3ZPE4_9GAMM|nr:META domain-containing protein [Pseudomarimonas arenosa]MBD8526492.1 META domain-containing protein [Pseudomarimonas arenosa]
MRWILLLCLSVGAVGCAANGGQGAQAVKEDKLTVLPEDSRWKLVSSDIEGLQAKASEAVRLEIAGGTLRGDTGCNQFFAGYSMDAAGAISMQPVVQSKRACAEPERNAVERALLDALRELQSASQRGDELVLHTAAGRLVFADDALVAE